MSEKAIAPVRNFNQLVAGLQSGELTIADIIKHTGMPEHEVRKVLNERLVKSEIREKDLGKLKGNRHRVT